MTKVIALTLLGSAGVAELQAFEDPALAATTPQDVSQPSMAQALKRRVFDPQAIQDSDRLWVEGEVLLWQASESGLDYGVKSSSQTKLSGHVEHPHFNWDWGFKLGIGYKLPHDKWDLFLNYTYVHANADGHAHASSNGAIFPTREAPFGLPNNFFAEKAHIHWNAALHIGDLELGRTCFLSRSISVRPFIGVRGLIIDQELDITYQGGTAVPAGFKKDKVDIHNDFWGVGLRVGFNSLWELGGGFGIYGDGAGSIVSGHFDVHQHEKFVSPNSNRVNFKNDQSIACAIAELALGLQWDHFFYKDRFHFGAKLGWEFNVFFNQNQMSRFLSGTNPGAISNEDDDLSFQGLSLGLRLDF